MKVLGEGHKYSVDNVDGVGHQLIQFVQRDPHPKKEGILNQELIRVLIDRVQFLDAELPWFGNQLILVKLREILVLHEMRAMYRDVEKGTLLPELIDVDSRGHWDLSGTLP